MEVCQTCAIYSPSRQREEEAEETYQPHEPMDLVVTDLFEIKGCHFLVVLDVFTGCPWMRKFGKSPKTHQVTEALNDIFLTWGYPIPVCQASGCQEKLGQLYGELKPRCQAFSKEP